MPTNSIYRKLLKQKLIELSSMFEKRRIKADSLLFEQGKNGHEAYLIASGRVKIFQTTEGKSVILAIRQAGELIGEMSLLDNAPRMAAACALDDCHLIVINQYNFNRILDEYPQISRAILADVVTRWRETEQAWQQELTKRKQVETQLQRLNQQLENRVAQRTEQLSQINSALQEFVYIASHDLQAPLQKIQTFGTILYESCQDKLNTEEQDYLHRMYKAAKRGQSLIRSLLQYSHVSTQPASDTVIDLNEAVADVLNDLELQITQCDATIEVENLPHIQANAVQIQQLFQNLISNALKYHQANLPPLVHITAIQTNGHSPHHIITICDNGIGFDETYAEYIFTPFKRLHNRSQYEGSGIGLSICRKIVERHGGKITAKSHLGKGTRISIEFPVMEV